MPELTDKQFIEAVYELAFGHDAINRNFGHAEVIDQLDYVINYDPTPSCDSPYSDAEYIITPEERDSNAMNSKRESHAHRYYSHNW